MRRKEMFMNLLEIESKKAYFILEDSKIEPDTLSKNELLKILNSVYENHDDVIFPDNDVFNSIVNPIEKEIVEQIIAKIKEFHANVPDIEKEINNQFPDLVDQISK